MRRGSVIFSFLFVRLREFQSNWFLFSQTRLPRLRTAYPPRDGNDRVRPGPDRPIPM